MSNQVNTMTIEQELAILRAEKQRLETENEALKASKARGISFKVGKRGGVAVYGLGRFPVTLYKSQWDSFLDEKNITALKAFIQAHESELKLLPTKEELDTPGKAVVTEQPAPAVAKSA